MTRSARGEISVIEAVAEELPDVFRTHVVPKLCIAKALSTWPE